MSSAINQQTIARHTENLYETFTKIALRPTVDLASGHMTIGRAISCIVFSQLLSVPFSY